MFVATLEGVIKKLVRVPGTNQTCVIEEIHLAAEDLQLPIRSLKLVKEQVRGGGVESKGMCRVINAWHSFTFTLLLCSLNVDIIFSKFARR